MKKGIRYGHVSLGVAMKANAQIKKEREFQLKKKPKKRPPLNQIIIDEIKKNKYS
jgi:hypothetical protein